MAHVACPEGCSPLDSPLGIRGWIIFITAQREKTAGETRSTFAKPYCYGPGFVQLHLEKAISIQTSGQECKAGENSWEGWLGKLGPGLRGPDPEICRAACLQSFTLDKPQEPRSTKKHGLCPSRVGKVSPGVLG